MFSGRNLILRAIEPAVRASFESRFERVALAKGQAVQETADEVEWVYFPVSGLIGMASETSGGESAQCTAVGFEGAIGVFEACGSRRAFYRAVVQVPGAAWRSRASTYRELFEESEGLRTAVHKMVELLLAESRQYVACNALHSLQSRLARLLADIQDKSLCGDTLPLTQDALAQMLGVQRTSVALAVGALQRAGVVRRGRGALEIADRAGLEREACTCRDAIQFVRDEIYRSFDQACE